ncbi:MAG: shikimate kinase [Planctomycetota bacterium]
MRVATNGNCASGKSMHARQLGESEGVTPLDLDAVSWEPSEPGIARPLEEWTQILRSRLASPERWILEGCDDATVAVVVDQRPEQIFLDSPEEVCPRHCRKRPRERHQDPVAEAQDALFRQHFESNNENR